MQLQQHAARINMTQFRSDEPGDSAINIPATMASRHEVAIIKTKKKAVMAVREIINVIG